MSTAAEMWRIEGWCALRVAGLPASVLAELRLRESADVERLLTAVEEEIASARAAAAARMFDVVHGCEDVDLRRAVLDAKRRLFGGKPVDAAALDRWSSSLPHEARAALGQVVALEARRDDLAARFDETIERERLAASDAFRRTLTHGRLLSGILLSSADHFATARKLAGLPAGARLSSAQQIREGAVARYVFRAATRTTPFSGLAAVALVGWADNANANAAHANGTRPRPSGVRWQSAPQIELRHLYGVLARADESTRLRQPLRINPLRSFVTTPAPVIVFPRLARRERTDDRAPLDWMELGWSEQVAAIVEAADGRTLDEAVAVLAAGRSDDQCEGHDEEGPFRDALEQLIDAGLIEIGRPSASPTPAGIRALARAFDGPSPSGPSCAPGASGASCASEASIEARTLRRLAGELETFAHATVAHREAGVSRMVSDLGPSPHGARSAVLEDVFLDGVCAADLPMAPQALARELDPLLRLLHASACGAAHRLVCAAFVARFGRDGVCRDVGAFITDLLRDAALVSRIRGARDPLRWLDSDLRRAIASAEGDAIQIAPSLFDALGRPEGPFATAIFLQWAAADDIRIVFNGAQGGRGKYLSRYLEADHAGARAARDAVRERLARTDGPLPVEIAPALALNFQIHPRLTEWTLETPWEPAASSAGVLPLSDLAVWFDAARHELRTSSQRLDREIDLVHLGFLRDVALPDPHFLLRALSPRLREDTVAERADLYNVLDRLALARGLPLVPHRPRLDVGRLVLERARWAVPAAAVPHKEPRQSYADYFREAARFRRTYGLPARGFARYVGRDATGFGFTDTRMYVDWETPLTLAGVRRLLRGTDDKAEGYVLFTELLPDPHASWLRIDGHPHAAELIVELDLPRGRS